MNLELKEKLAEYASKYYTRSSVEEADFGRAIRIFVPEADYFLCPVWKDAPPHKPLG